MNNFYLYNQAIDLEDLDAFKMGISSLNETKAEGSEYDEFLKSSSIYDEVSILQTLFHNWSPDTKIVLQFIEQLTSIKDVVDNEEDLNTLYPNDCNGFMGIDFEDTNILPEVQVTDLDSFNTFKKTHFVRKKIADKDELDCILDFLYPDYSFEDRALEDIIYWNEENIDTYERLHYVLKDVGENPFTGGIGKTEVLKNRKGVASKRINDEHRLTYSLKDEAITILACKGHYT